MAISIPNLKLKYILEQLIGAVRADYASKVTQHLESESWLYRCFYGVRYGSFDYYTQAKEVIINRNDNNIKKLNIRNGFSLAEKPDAPTIHFNVPSEQQGGVNAIGMNLDTGVFFEDSASDQYNELYGRTFEGMYELIITSPSVDEVELIYRFLQALFIAESDTLNANFDGVFSFSGKQIIANPDLMPNPLFIKVLVVKLQNTISVPKLNASEYLNNAEFSGYFVDDMLYEEGIGINQL